LVEAMAFFVFTNGSLVVAINIADITFLKVMFRDLRLASKIIEIPFKVMEKIILRFHGKKA